MQTQILDKNPTANVRVYAVWVPFLGGTEQAASVSVRVLPDPRVLPYWDGGAATSDWFATKVDQSSAPAWDVYYLYGPSATWTSVPKPLLSTGRTIIGQSSQLESAITPLLQGSSSGSP